MFYTARQLDALLRESGTAGSLVLPYRARLTPAAQDWVRLKKVKLGYGDLASAGGPAAAGGSPSSVAAVGGTGGGEAGAAANVLLWWCDGPCGPAKAAITAQAKESPLKAVEVPADAKHLVPALKAVAAELKKSPAAAAVLVVQSAAAAVVLANRCPSARAVVGTSLEAVEHGIRQVAANVLVIEHPRATLSQVKSMIARFARAKRELSPDVQRQLAELAACG
ncbi:MAG: hypothetical protein JWO31_2235 [Phycisphaerales bacterium]|nr:hypothetical protein [Phycisphaerales bacterium]